MEPLAGLAVIGDDETADVSDAVTGEVVAVRDLDCSGACDGLVVDGIDSGAVFVRTSSGTAVWEFRHGDAMTPFAGPRTRLADVCHGVALSDGPAPHGGASGDWRLVPGAIDAQLTLDGRYVLHWSSRLGPTHPGDDAVTLEASPGEDRGFWTIDTDGSVLVAVPDGSGARVAGARVAEDRYPA